MNVDIALTLYSKYTKSLDLSTPEDVISLARNIELADGTGSGKANRHWSDERSLAEGANETIDLMALTDAFGRTLTFTKLKFLYIKNTSTVELTIGRAMAPIALFVNSSDMLIVNKGNYFLLADSLLGLDIAVQTKDIKVTAGIGAALTYEIILIGEGTVA